MKRWKISHRFGRFSRFMKLIRMISQFSIFPNRSKQFHMQIVCNDVILVFFLHFKSSIERMKASNHVVLVLTKLFPPPGNDDSKSFLVEAFSFINLHQGNRGSDGSRSKTFFSPKKHVNSTNDEQEVAHIIKSSEEFLLI